MKRIALSFLLLFALFGLGCEGASTCFREPKRALSHISGGCRRGASPDQVQRDVAG